MPDQETQVEPGFALVRNKKTGSVYATKWRDEDTEVIRDLEVDAYEQPVMPSAEEIADLTKKPAPAPKKEQS